MEQIELDGRLEMLQNQRNDSQNQVVLLAGALKAALAKIAELEAKLPKEE